MEHLFAMTLVMVVLFVMSLPVFVTPSRQVRKNLRLQANPPVQAGAQRVREPLATSAVVGR
jgi:hypothetical protein